MCMLITLILVASGWKEHLLKGISNKGIVLFACLWISGIFITIPLTSTLHVHTTYLALLILTVIALAEGSMNSGVHLIVISCLLGAIVYLLKFLFAIDPFLVITYPIIDISIAIGLLTWLTTRSLLQQVAAVSMAVMIGEIMDVIINEGAFVNVLGGAAFQDDWWLAIYMTRLFTLTGLSLYAAFRLTRRQLTNWMRGLKK